MSEIAVGLIGFGAAGRYLHAPVIASAGGFQIAKVATSRADEVAATLPGAVATTPATVIGDPAIELVVAATPDASHAPLALQALAAGKHVVIDKPMALDATEADSLIAAARAAGRVLSVYHNRRWDSDFLTVRGLLDQGTLGDVVLAEFCWDRFRPALRESWREDRAFGAGLLPDLGSHLIDQALQLFGRPDALDADLATQRAGGKIDDYVSLTFHYPARRVRLAAASLVANARPRFALHGTSGSFVKYGLDPQEAWLRAGASPDQPGYGIEPADTFGRLTRADGTSEVVPSAHGDWRAFYRGMRAAIRDGAPPPVDPADARAGLAIIAAARAGAASGVRQAL